ncbi:bifunctional [glutamate--ammonia ligase]-adenylyl-L-tyrosine phosphorylase/[glutamate--ammonia-ligase] adenylyltransferase [Haemophilus pittmaniae]|uniref:bifunctional [glutamate--ammonia ligase]-adenylyl-L-tyrosine phosphorylase/[glutamate--ammonia-ligase] adenylyltransferase n=1 Tax=Haemophilus pittmaniae TaxID=249188 RepID=UPI000B949D50|nr:bifunctional [glutamate--ammonia ligase]-adenylyl-L-tyrosine phosphorylase/[glutamate--ammonia-ligase] adenylyltransferase [Haemophilus pittmaniae]SNV89157.1 bifunctional deadenylyltransferase/adenylyltransferase [Haemophilus pittmaniae]
MEITTALIEEKLIQLIELLPESQQKGYLNQLSHIAVNSPLQQIGYAIAMSDFLQKFLSRPLNPTNTTNQEFQLTQWLKSPPTFADCDNYSQRLAIILNDVIDEDELYRNLRYFRYQEMAKLSFCQSLNLATVEQIFIQLSELAEALIIGARDWLYQKACEEMGTPLDDNGYPQQLYILGMGKLGGKELNFSSDIDLIFTYPQAGETSGGRRAVDNQKFFTRLGQRLINALDQFTAEGFVYRTDMRLRPFGDNGALALSFSALEQYYQDQGRDWERYAMIKARVLGLKENDPQALILQKLLRPFVYRRYIDFSAIQALREMKNKIAREVRRRGLINNIKLGAGGIREIEFIVQVFQLIRGGRENALQQHSLLNILPELSRLSLISAEQEQALRAAYIFLRRVENLLQAIDDQQTQVLPDNQLDRSRLILGCKQYSYFDEYQNITMHSEPFANWEGFYHTLQQHQKNVRDVFNGLIGEEKEDNNETEQWAGFLDADQTEILQILTENGVEQDHQAELAEKLQLFNLSLARRAIGHRGREVLTRLMPTLLNLIFLQTDYNTLLPRILNLIDKIAGRTTYLELLQENPPALTQLIELCSHSPMIAEQLARHPILLDELLNAQALRNPLPLNEYSAELTRYLLRLPPDDEELFIDGLRQFKQMMLLKVAAADILGVLPVMKVSDHLTYLAEAIIGAVVNFAWEQVSRRFGVPEALLDKPDEKGFLVVGYGKLGGLELGYKSDLDLVFLYQPLPGFTAGGKKSIDNNQFYLRLAQKIVSIFSLNTSAGVLYEVDMRLRPSGDAGLLGCSFQAFENYQLNEAWTWETQALVRARSVYGEAHLQHQFTEIRQRVLMTPRDINKLTQDVIEMRQKMYEHLSHSSKDQFNLKTDRGGITDIEFIAQYLMLAHAPKNPLLTRWSDNVRIFDSMVEQNIILQDEGEALKNAYTAMRNKIHQLNLLGHPPIVEENQFVSERQFIYQCWQRWLENSV